jgi:ribokinase
MKKCAVIGSINMDMVVNGPRFPRPGETLTGTAFQTVPGGKGANQAIALAKLGVPLAENIWSILKEQESRCLVCL